VRRSKGLLAFLALALCALGFGVAAAAADPPEVTTPQVPDVSYATAQASGELDANGFAEWFFEVSTDGVNWERKSETEFSGSETLEPVSAELTELKPGTTYKVRLRASNSSDPIVVSPEPSPEITTLPLDPPTVTIDPVATFTGTTAKLTGEIGPNPPAGNPVAAAVDWHFECTPECPNLQGGTVPAGATGSEQVVEAEATGLEPNTTYEVTLVGKNAGDPVSDGPVSFKTETVAPSVETMPAFVLEGATSALVGGRVNPRNSDTEYWIEYGPTATYGSSTQHVGAGSGATARVVSQEATGLEPGSTYHVRVVSENSTDRTNGNDLTFKTPQLPAHEPTGSECPNSDFRTGPSADLRECRAYELVTTPDLLGNSAGVEFNVESNSRWNEVSTDGERVLWTTLGQLPGSDSTGSLNAYLSSRTPSGWAASYVSPPGSKIETRSIVNYATPDLRSILFSAYGAEIDPSDQDHSGNDIYRREVDGSWVWLSSPLTGGLNFTEIGAFQGTSEDADAVYLKALTGEIFRRVAGTATLVNRDESGTVVSGPGNLRVSDDGSVASFTSGALNGGLYLYDDALSHAIKLADNTLGLSGTVSADGSRVIIRTSEQLTSDDLDSGRDLYEYDIATGTYRLLSIPTGGSGSPGPGNRDNCNPQFQIYPEGCDVFDTAISKDGRSVYFISPEQLDGDRGVLGQANLYLAGNGVTHYVTTLAPEEELWQHVTSDGGNVGAEEARRRLHFTPDGSKLLFETRRRITAYDNDGHLAIYSYDQESGELSCVSCRPTGQPPTGDSTLRVPGTDRPSPFQIFAKEAPVWPMNADLHGNHLFYESDDKIVPGDTNGLYDTYEYDAATAEPSLISSGTSDGDSAYLGNSLDGRDVFFFTLENLTGNRTNRGVFKIFDARREGGFPEEVKVVRCSGEGCRQGPSPGSEGAPPPTAHFVGPDNASERARQMRVALKACKKKKTAKARKSCMTRVRHRYAPSGAKKDAHPKKGAH
jgi:hypothetical protein